MITYQLLYIHPTKIFQVWFVITIWWLVPRHDSLLSHKNLLSTLLFYKNIKIDNNKTQN